MTPDEIVAKVKANLAGELPDWIEQQIELARDANRAYQDAVEVQKSTHEKYLRVTKWLAELNKDFKEACMEVARENGVNPYDVETLCDNEEVQQYWRIAR